MTDTNGVNKPTLPESLKRLRAKAGTVGAWILVMQQSYQRGWTKGFGIGVVVGMLGAWFGFWLWRS